MDGFTSGVVIGAGLCGVERCICNSSLFHYVEPLCEGVSVDWCGLEGVLPVCCEGVDNSHVVCVYVALVVFYGSNACCAARVKFLQFDQ